MKPNREELLRSSCSDTDHANILNTTNATEDAAYQIHLKNEKSIFWSRVLVVFVLIIALGATVTTTFILTIKQDYEDFEIQFQSCATKVITAAKENLKSTFESIEAYSASVSSLASFANMTWPYVTIPDFAARSERLMNLSHARGVGFYTIVNDDERQGWLRYSEKNARIWYQNSIDYLELNETAENLVNKTEKDIFKIDWGTYEILPEDKPGPWLVVWQSYPLYNILGTMTTNYNVLNAERISNVFFSAAATLAPSLGFIVTGLGDNAKAESQIIQPIFEKVDNVRGGIKKLVGAVSIVIDWSYYFQNLLPENADGIVAVLNTGCSNDSITYQINGLEAVLLGDGDLHDPTYDDLEVSVPFLGPDSGKFESVAGRCSPDLTLHLYPSKQMQDDLATNDPTSYAINIVGIFIFISVVFIIYDCSVRRQQKKVMTLQGTTDFDSFPSKTRDNLFATDDDPCSVNDGCEKRDVLTGQTIADLFPNVTIVFADIAGFTAWSSAREPPQVFQLLEKIFGAFDDIASRHGVFKIETVGDCYVAAAGLPDPRPDHAIAASRFAADILRTMRSLTKNLEVTLGPDTADLELRVGIHSGQVTAGVLRGKRSRFQLFGDSVNIAARMESTSKRNRIQLSKVTAEELIQSGKADWIKSRTETVFVKGKGEMQTYWLEPLDAKERPKVSKELIETFKISGSDYDDVSAWEDTSMVSEDTICGSMGMSKMQRLVEWNVEILSKLLQQILAARELKPDKCLVDLEQKIGKGSTVLEEFIPIITLPKVRVKDLKKRKDPDSIELSDAVTSQLREYLTEIAGLYRNNEFHNFEHASHVTASVRKLLTRIVNVDQSNGMIGNNNIELVDLAGHSYGITSDPLTQFAVVFSAVIHDVDHPGVPNTQLVKEKTRNALIYKEKSVAEQNSVDLSWELLMLPEYAELRSCIYSNAAEFKRFRQLVVNTVMATDICDKELQALRKARWETAFSDDNTIDSTSSDLDVDRKATIVIEHLIQASDVSHTMQHWEIYKNWNERLFLEMYGAYKAGRAGTDPSLNWYKGEIGFFDFYIIPLAKKLESCGVFGVSSHEYLNYAMSNRDEWEREGQCIVEKYVQTYLNQSEDYSGISMRRFECGKSV